MSIAQEVWEILQELNGWLMLALVVTPLFVVVLLDGKSIRIQDTTKLYIVFGSAAFVAAVAGFITHMGLWVVVGWLAVVGPAALVFLLQDLRRVARTAKQPRLPASEQ